MTNKVEKIILDYNAELEKLTKKDLIEMNYFFYKIYAIVGENDDNHIYIGFKFKDGCTEEIKKNFNSDFFYNFKFFKSKRYYVTDFRVVFNEKRERAYLSTGWYSTGDEKYQKGKVRQEIVFNIAFLIENDAIDLFKYKIEGEFNFKEFDVVFKNLDIFLNKEFSNLKYKMTHPFIFGVRE
jgi:hypothetical protein